MIWWDGQGACLFTKRIEHGDGSCGPQLKEGKSQPETRAQLAMLMEGIDWPYCARRHGGPSMVG